MPTIAHEPCAEPLAAGDDPNDPNDQDPEFTAKVIARCKEIGRLRLAPSEPTANRKCKIMGCSGNVCMWCTLPCSGKEPSDGLTCIFHCPVHHTPVTHAAWNPGTASPIIPTMQQGDGESMGDGERVITLAAALDISEHESDDDQAAFAMRQICQICYIHHQARDDRGHACKI